MVYGDMWSIQVVGEIIYNVESGAATPPSSGWEGTEEETDPAPSVSGGEPCTGDSGAPPPPGTPSAPVAITVVPSGGAAGFLDVILESEEPVMVGLLPLAAIHAVGDAVTGGSTSGPIHVYINSVDTAVQPESVVLVDHWMSSYNRTTGEYEFSWDTSGMAPGYYDVRLSFGTYAYNFRIQLI